MKYNPSVVFSTNYCYKLIDEQASPNNNFKWIWDLKCPNKIKFFRWKCYHNRLPSRAYLSKIGMNIDPNCPICKNTNETIAHSFWESYIAKAFWDLMDWNINPLARTTHWVDRLKKC